MGAAPAVELAARGRQSFPQRGVALAVDAADLLPLLDDRAVAVASCAPVAAGREFLGLVDELLLFPDGRGGDRRTLFGLLRHALVDLAEHTREPGVETGQVADHRSLRQR